MEAGGLREPGERNERVWQTGHRISQPDRVHEGHEINSPLRIWLKGPCLFRHIIYITHNIKTIVRGCPYTQWIYYTTGRKPHNEYTTPRVVNQRLTQWLYHTRQVQDRRGGLHNDNITPGSGRQIEYRATTHCSYSTHYPDFKTKTERIARTTRRHAIMRLVYI